jgi:hypothetical protein
MYNAAAADWACGVFLCFICQNLACCMLVDFYKTGFFIVTFSRFLGISPANPALIFAPYFRT